MAGNKNLGTAKRQKKDEFYTQLSDIENELKHYKDFFKGKTVLCNCDDPFESNFFKFFAMNFNSLGLKKLITTCYAASPVEWGLFYNRYGTKKFDPKKLEKRIGELLYDEEVTNQKGIYEYLLDGNECHLSIRSFSPQMARTAYELQGGICPKCGKYFNIERMQADHIKPWSKGGRTTVDNCQMLCADCNRRKSNI